MCSRVRVPVHPLISGMAHLITNVWQNDGLPLASFQLKDRLELNTREFSVLQVPISSQSNRALDYCSKTIVLLQ